MLAGSCGPRTETSCRVHVVPWSRETASQSEKVVPSKRSNGMYRLCQYSEAEEVSATTGPAIQKFGSCGSGHAVGPRSPTPGCGTIVAAVQSLCAKSAGVFAPPSFV